MTESFFAISHPLMGYGPNHQGPVAPGPSTPVNSGPSTRGAGGHGKLRWELSAPESDSVGSWVLTSVRSWDSAWVYAGVIIFKGYLQVEGR